MLTDEQRDFWGRQIEQAHEYIDDLGHEPRTSWQLRQATYIAVDARLTALDRVAEAAREYMAADRRYHTTGTIGTAAAAADAEQKLWAALAALDGKEPQHG